MATQSKSTTICDGIVDEAIEPCTNDLPASDAMAFAHAIDACHSTSFASFGAPGIDRRSRGIFQDYGDSYTPRTGSTFAALSTGIVGDASDPGFVRLDPGTDFDFSASHPEPAGAMGCSADDPEGVEDLTQLVLRMQVPANAKSFSFDFNFMSAEFPEFVCSSFDDTFFAILESAAFSGNISFDSMGNRVSINVGFFDKCRESLDAACTGDDELMGTGYEGTEGGGTGWLTTTAPVVPGEKIKLSFLIFDEGDPILDSAVLIDNFRWKLEAVEGPVTIPRLVDASVSHGTMHTTEE